MPAVYPPFKPCPCGSGRSFSACCDAALSGAAPAPTAEALMRSRYTAFVLRHEPYLLATWHASTRPAALNLREDQGTKWQGLRIHRTEAGGVRDDAGVVEFTARYAIGGDRHRLHETSRFVREDGRWFYVDGTLHDS